MSVAPWVQECVGKPLPLETRHWCMQKHNLKLYYRSHISTLWKTFSDHELLSHGQKETGFVFCGEVNFSAFGKNGCWFIWAKDEKNHTGCCHIKGPKASICDGIGVHQQRAMDDIYMCECTIYADEYIWILSGLWLLHFFLVWSVVNQHNNTRLVPWDLQQCGYIHRVCVRDWAAGSPDLSPAEHQTTTTDYEKLRCSQSELFSVGYFSNREIFSRFLQSSNHLNPHLQKQKNPSVLTFLQNSIKLVSDGTENDFPYGHIC